MYRIVTYDEADEQIAGLSIEGLLAYAQLLDVLQLTPWNGPSINSRTTLMAPSGSGRSAEVWSRT